MEFNRVKLLEPMRRATVLLCTVALLALLSGCLYPDDRRGENQISGLEYVGVVQSAVDQYQAKTALLPIKNSTMDTPLYEKYVIDFDRLLQTPFLSQVPPNAYEKGGRAQYVLIDVEEKPLVRLLDLVSAQMVNDVQRDVVSYMESKQGKAPLGVVIGAGWHALDFVAMGKSAVQVRSVYSSRYLSLLVNKSGQVIVDYGPDLMTLIQDQAITPEEGADLRKLLTDNSMFVPVKSAAYYWRDGEPAIAAG